MEPSIPPTDARYAFESQVREAYGRVAYTHKTHLKMADRCGARQSQIKLLQIVVSGIIAGGAVGAVIADSKAAGIVTAIIATLNVILASYLKDVNPGATAALHCDAGSQLWKVREDFLSLITDARDEAISLAYLQQRREELISRLAEIYRGAPPTDAKAYAQAQDALKNKEDLTFSEQEIDLLLPNALRRGGQTRQIG